VPNRRGPKLALLMLLALLLSGCGRLTGHVTVNRDGSAELQISAGLASSTAALLSNEQVLSMFKQYLSEHGFKLEERVTAEGTELVAHRHLDNAAELLELTIPSSIGAPAAEPLQVTHGLLSDSYRLQLDLDLADWLSGQVTDWQLRLAKLVLSGQELSLQVTLPWVAKEHNADSVQDNGHTLGWKLTLDRPRQIEFRLLVPNRNLLLLVAGALVTSACYVVAWLGRSKRR